MRIRMTKLSAGPTGVRRPGEIHDVNDAEAQALIGAGGADAVETAAMVAPENTARRTKRPSPRGARRKTARRKAKGKSA